MAKSQTVNTTDTQTTVDTSTSNGKDATPYGVEFHGHITVARAAAIANEKVSTINYWLREGIVSGFRLETEERSNGEAKDRSAFLLVSRASLQTWLDGKSARDAEKEAKKQARIARDAELEEIRKAEKALAEKRAALLASKKGAGKK